MFIGRYKKTYSKQKIAFMINRPLNVSPAKPPANPSPTFFTNYMQSGEENDGEERMKMPLVIFHIRLYFFAKRKLQH